jgi:hypothetical protein
MIRLKILLGEGYSNSTDEAVKFSKFGDVQKGMEGKYGDGLLGGTFGVELEYKGEPEKREPVFEPFDDLDSFINANRSRLRNNFFDWLDDRRDDLNYKYAGEEAAEWDNKFGPIDGLLWSYQHPKPMHYDEQEKWQNMKDALDKQYAHWRSQELDGQLFTNFCQEAWEDGTGPYEFSYELEWDEDDDGEQSSTIAETIRFIRRLGEDCEEGDDADADTWAVGMDGSNVELRTKHLRLEDLPKLERVMGFLDSMDTTGNMSAHVHVGLPENFNAFDLLALWNLVDEEQVQIDIGLGRNLKQWSKLQDYLSNTLIKMLSQISPSIGEKNILPMRVLKRQLANSEKFTGTNLRAFFDHHTVEFRYFSSNIKGNPDLFFQWIKYFLLLPKIASTRSQVVLKEDVFKIVITRMGNDNIKVDKVDINKKVSTPGRPMSQLSIGTVEEPLKQRLAKKFGKKISDPSNPDDPTDPRFEDPAAFLPYTTTVMNHYGYALESGPEPNLRRARYVNVARDKTLTVYGNRSVRYSYLTIGNWGMSSWPTHTFPTWATFIHFALNPETMPNLPPIQVRPPQVRPAMIDLTEADNVMREVGYHIATGSPNNNTTSQRIYTNNDESKYVYVYADGRVKYLFTRENSNWDMYDFPNWGTLILFAHGLTNIPNIPSLRDNTPQ